MLKNKDNAMDVQVKAKQKAICSVCGKQERCVQLIISEKHLNLCQRCRHRVILALNTPELEERT